MPVSLVRVVSGRHSACRSCRKTIRKTGEKGTGGDRPGVGNPLSFCFTYEFPAMYVYGFRDRFASREIGLSPLMRSAHYPASAFPGTRGHVLRNRPFNYVFHQVGEIRRRERVEFRGESRHGSFHARLIISFVSKRKACYTCFRKCTMILLIA